MTFEEIWEGCDLEQIDKRSLVAKVVQIKKMPPDVKISLSNGLNVSFCLEISPSGAAREPHEAERQLEVFWRLLFEFRRRLSVAFDVDRIRDKYIDRPFSDGVERAIRSDIANVRRRREREGSLAPWEMFGEIVLGSLWRDTMHEYGYGFIMEIQPGDQS